MAATITMPCPLCGERIIYEVTGVAIDRDGEIYRGTGTYHRLSGRVSVEADHRCRS